MTNDKIRGFPQGLESRFFREVLKIRHLRILVALDQMGQITKVAKAFNVTQPAISKQIVELERELGSAIICRRGNAIAFTPIGDLLVRHAKDVLHRIQRAEFDIDAFRKGLGGHVRVSAVASLMPTILPKAVRLMLQAAPLSQVTVAEGHFNQMLPALMSGEIDMIVTRVWKPMGLNGVAQLSLGFEPIVVVAGSDHPLARENGVTWEAALKWPWVRASSGSLASEAVNEFLAEQGYGPLTGRVEATSVMLTLQLLRTLPYLAALPEGLARHHSGRGELSILPLNFAGVLSEARCFWLSDRTDETVTLFRACLARAAEDQFAG